LLLGPAALLFSPATLFLGLATAATDEPQDPAGNRTDGAANQPADPRTDRGTRGWLAADALYQPDESVHGSQQCRDALGQRLERVCQGLALLQEHLDAGGPGLLPVAGREPGDELPCSAELPKDGLLDPGAHLLPGRNLLGHVAQGIQGLSGRQGHVARLDQGLPEHPGGLVDLSLGEAAQEEVAALGLRLEVGQSTGKFGLAGAAQGVDQLIELRPHAPVVLLEVLQALHGDPLGNAGLLNAEFPERLGLLLELPEVELRLGHPHAIDVLGDLLLGLETPLEGLLLQQPLAL